MFEVLDSEADDTNIPEIKIDKPADYAYYPGCVDFYDMEMQFSVENYGETNHGIIIDSTIKLLRAVGIDPLVLERTYMKCCGHDQLWQGKTEAFLKMRDYNTKIIKQLGVKTIVVSCGEGYRTFLKDYNLEGIEVRHITQVLIERGFKLPETTEGEVRVTYQDPCRMCRQMGGQAVYDEPRELLQNAPGVEYVEMEHFRESLHCCGVAGMMYCNPKTKGLTFRRMGEAKEVEADYLLTACPKCLTHFGCLNHEDLFRKEGDKFAFKVQDVTQFLAERLPREASEEWPEPPLPREPGKPAAQRKVVATASKLAPPTPAPGPAVQAPTTKKELPTEAATS